MKCSRGVPVVLTMMVVVVLGSAGWLVPRAHAQIVDRLRPEVTTTENLTNDQRQQIAQYIDGWANRLLNDDVRQVTEARRRLLEPLRAGNPSTAFTRHYSEQTADRIGAALEHDQPVVRVNTMIVVARLHGENAMPLIERAIGDENAAVRYWAVKATQTVSFTDDQKRRLTNRLVDHVAREPEMQVIEQTLLALVELDLSEARTQVLTLLDGRVEHHLGEPGLSLQAEHSGLRGIYHHLAGAGDPDEDQLRQLGRVAVRYQELASQRLANEAVSEDIRNSYESILQLCNAALRFVGDSLDVTSVPSSIDPLINRGDWAGIQRNAERWRTLMQQAPFNFTAEEVELNG